MKKSTVVSDNKIKSLFSNKSLTTAKETTALIPVTNITSVPTINKGSNKNNSTPNLEIVLNDENRSRVEELAAEFNLIEMNPNEVILYGNHLQQNLSQKLDTILAEITKGNSPVLFELFATLKNGVDKANLAEIEAEIRKNLNTGVFYAILDKLGLSSVAARVQKANDKVNLMITSKATSIGTLVSTMETSVRDEALKLVENTNRLKDLGTEYRNSIEEIGVFVEAGRKIHKNACNVYFERESSIKSVPNPDPVAVQDLKRVKQILDMFESRVLVLETMYVKAPVEMEFIRLGEGAALTTLGETANSVIEEFNDIKSTLIKLSVTHQIQTVQMMNHQRRELRKSLQNHGTNLLEEVSVNAEKNKGLNRLEDATQLLDIANRVSTIFTKIEAETNENKNRFAEAKEKLVAAKELITKI